MARPVPARLTAAEGRKFGFTVGGVFVALAALLYFWRHAQIVPGVFGVVGGLLIIAAAVAPRSLGPVERGWMKLAHLISKVTTPVFMSIVYFLVITPFGLVRRAIGKNALVRASGDAASGDSHWVVRKHGRTRSDLSRQF